MCQSEINIGRTDQVDVDCLSFAQIRQLTNKKNKNDLSDLMHVCKAVGASREIYSL